MKTISAAFSTHLDGEVTTLCTCWRIERTDGVVLGFTTLDRDIEYNGITYESQYGYSRSALTAGSDMSVDNMDVTGVLDSERIDNGDLRNGVYNFARVFVFLLNYEDVTQGELPLRTGWFGEVSMNQRGEFTAEIRGLAQALSHASIEIFTPECRADFCDSRCKLNVVDYTRRASVLATNGIRRDNFRASALPAVPAVTSAGAHRVWGVRIIEMNPKTGAPQTGPGSFADVKFFDQSLNNITGGTADASSEDNSHEASKARDGKTTTTWCTGDDIDPIGEVWWVTFPSAVDVREIMITATRDYGDAPTRWALVYADMDANGDRKPFVEVDQYAVTWTESYQNVLWGIGSGTAPIGSAVGANPVPAPETGKSTYVGGTVTFRTGANTGKSMEIAGFETSNNTITLFEALPFPIAVGDLFDIVQGCDKSRQNCKLYDNIINFRGEPDVPGQDEYLRYPDAPPTN